MLMFAKGDEIASVLILFACLAGVLIAIAPIFIWQNLDKLRREMREYEQSRATRENKIISALVAMLNELSKRSS